MANPEVMTPTDLMTRDSDDLDDFASISAPPRGHSVPATAPQFVGAQKVAVYRDDKRVLAKLKALSAAAGTDFFYRFPVKSKDGTKSFIEGASIKLANDVARIYGNCAIEVRDVDIGEAWVFNARFSDYETGFVMERLFRQRKAQVSIGTPNADRQMDIAFQIGQSKAIRNVICNALQTYCDFAFEEARGSLVDKIGKDIEGWRKRTVDGIANMGCELHRVERVIGRSAKEWLAPDISLIISNMKAIADGMASLDESFPPDAKAADSAPAAAADTKDLDDLAARQTEKTMGTTQAAPAESSADVLEIARERGRQAKEAGQTRKAIPPEYRTAARGQEAEAWYDGFETTDNAQEH